MPAATEAASSPAEKLASSISLPAFKMRPQRSGHFQGAAASGGKLALPLQSTRATRVTSTSSSNGFIVSGSGVSMVSACISPIFTRRSTCATASRAGDVFGSEVKLAASSFSLDAASSSFFHTVSTRWRDLASFRMPAAVCSCSMPMLGAPCAKARKVATSIKFCIGAERPAREASASSDGDVAAERSAALKLASSTSSTLAGAGSRVGSGSGAAGSGSGAAGSGSGSGSCSGAAGSGSGAAGSGSGAATGSGSAAGSLVAVSPSADTSTGSVAAAPSVAGGGGGVAASGWAASAVGAVEAGGGSTGAAVEGAVAKGGGAASAGGAAAAGAAPLSSLIGMSSAAGVSPDVPPFGGASAACSPSFFLPPRSDSGMYVFGSAFLPPLPPRRLDRPRSPDGILREEPGLSPLAAFSLAAGTGMASAGDAAICFSCAAPTVSAPVCSSLMPAGAARSEGALLAEPRLRNSGQV